MLGLPSYQGTVPDRFMTQVGESGVTKASGVSGSIAPQCSGTNVVLRALAMYPLIRNTLGEPHQYAAQFRWARRMGQLA